MNSPATSSLYRIAEHVAHAPLSAFGPSLDCVRDALIDVYGCILAGAREPTAQKTRQALLDAGLIVDSGGAPIFGTDLCAAAGYAAMANAVAGHALEFDDWEIPGNTHISVLLVPAILAVSSGQRLAGSAAVAAYLAGFETVARIGEAIGLDHYRHGWHATATIGALGVAAAVSRLLQLDSKKTANALAIATSRALGFKAQFGSEAKPLQVGFAVEGGILAARLAAAGLSGQLHMLDHEAGMAALMGAEPGVRIAAAMDRIGGVPAIDEYGIVFKPWPSCGYTHRIMTGMLEIRKLGLDRNSIDAIELQLPEMHAGILPYRHPENREQALFSLPYCAAMVLQFGDLSLADLERESWRLADIMRLIDATRIMTFSPARPELNYDPRQPDRIRIDAGGERHEITTPYPLGAPQNPLPAGHLERKFLSTCGLDEPSARQLWQHLQDWPIADDLHDLFSAQPATNPRS